MWSGVFPSPFLTLGWIIFSAASRDLWNIDNEDKRSVHGGQSVKDSLYLPLPSDNIVGRALELGHDVWSYFAQPRSQGFPPSRKKPWARGCYFAQVQITLKLKETFS